MSVRTDLLETAATVGTLLSEEVLARRWEETSALESLSVGGLAGHLARAVGTVDAYLDREIPSSVDVVLDPAGYYLSIPGLDDPSAELHTQIRARGEEAAASGPAALVAGWNETVTRLSGRLAMEPPTRLIVALGGRVMRLDDYLVTRLVEMVVHADDLAMSLAVPAPEFPPSATYAAIGCLVELARRRHGDMAVLRGLARRERDTVEALRVL